MSENIHRLEGSNSSVGGLVIRKKTSEDNEFTTPKLPHLAQKSLLGLDRLAAQKEKEKFKEKSKTAHEDIEKRKYRRSNETPSYTGGVSREAQKRRDDRRERERERERGVKVYNHEKRRDREWRNERSYDRRSSDKRSDRKNDTRHRRDWDLTPGSKRSKDGDYDTPYMKSKETPSQMPWDDEDHRYDFIS